MSPSEFDLRAALRDGEGDPVDADRVIRAGKARAAHRRYQLRVGITATALVVGFGFGIFGLTRVSGPNESGSADMARSPAFQVQSNSSRDAGGKQPSSSAAVAPAPVAPSGAHGTDSESAASSAGATCPERAPAVLRPGIGDPSARMFTAPVSSLVVCAYDPANASAPSTIELSGARARQLAASLENSARARSSAYCPAYVRADERTLRILATSTTGTSLAPVTATLNATPCRVVVSNGVAVRYGWTPPVALGPLLRQLVSPSSAPSS